MLILIENLDQKCTVLLTGATGFLGSYLLKSLLNEGYSVVILTRSKSQTWRISHLLKQVKCYNLDHVTLSDVFVGNHIDFVIHTACNYGRNGESTSEVVETNLMFGLRLLDVAISQKAEAFFNADTTLQKHINDYSLSKSHFVEWLQKSSELIQIVNIRLGHMYGPLDDTKKFIPWLLSQFQKNLDHVDLTLGEQLCDFVYITDVASAFITAIQKIKQLQSFNQFDVGSGLPASLRSIVEKFSFEYRIQHPEFCTRLNFGAIPYRNGEVMSVNSDINPMLALGWKPKVELLEGIRKVIKFNQVF